MRLVLAFAATLLLSTAAYACGEPNSTPCTINGTLEPPPEDSPVEGTTVDPTFDDEGNPEDASPEAEPGPEQGYEPPAGDEENSTPDESTTENAEEPPPDIQLPDSCEQEAWDILIHQWPYAGIGAMYEMQCSIDRNLPELENTN